MGVGCLFCASLFATEIINSKDSNGGISSNTNSVSGISFIAALVFCRVTMFHHLWQKQEQQSNNTGAASGCRSQGHDAANGGYYWLYINSGDPCDLSKVDG